MQTKRKSRIVSLKYSFMNPKLLVFAVVLAILFVAIGASMSSTQGTMEDTLRGPLEQWFESMEKTTRPSFLVIPVFTRTVEDEGEAFLFLLNFYEMYPSARIPYEFSSHTENDITPTTGTTAATIYSSLLLTMAYQQGYRIETVTDSYIILVKSVSIESEEKGEE